MGQLPLQETLVPIAIGTVTSGAAVAVRGVGAISCRAVTIVAIAIGARAAIGARDVLAVAIGI